MRGFFARCRFDTVVPEIEQRGTVLREPLTPERLAGAEERLGVRLPPSYSGASVALSFGDWLWVKVNQESWWPEPWRADEYVEQVRRGEFHALRALAEVGDPRAGELAARVLDEEWGDEWNRSSAAVVLRQLGDAEHLPTLRRAYARARFAQVRVWGSSGRARLEG